MFRAVEDSSHPFLEVERRYQVAYRRSVGATSASPRWTKTLSAARSSSLNSGTMMSTSSQAGVSRINTQNSLATTLCFLSRRFSCSAAAPRRSKQRRRRGDDQYPTASADRDPARPKSKARVYRWSRRNSCETVIGVTDRRYTVRSSTTVRPAGGSGHASTSMPSRRNDCDASRYFSP